MPVCIRPLPPRGDEDGRRSPSLPCALDGFAQLRKCHRDTVSHSTTGIVTYPFVLLITGWKTELLVFI